ncbi:MAG: n-acetylglutamate synthase [Bacteroidota bacterium]
MINYNGRNFCCLSDPASGMADNDTIFYCKQSGLHITATYSGGNIVDGSLTAMADDAGNLNIRFQHININGQFLTGTCFSRPQIMTNGKIRLNGQWHWTCGDYSKGASLLEEI